MQTELDISTAMIPYGVLHDQVLTDVRYENGSMTFTFASRMFPEDYPEETYQKYSAFRRCDMIVTLSPEPFLYFYLETCPDRYDRYRGYRLNSAEFLDVIRNAETVTFLECSAACRELQIEFAVNLFAAKGKYRKYRKAAVCRALLDATNVQWKWS